MLRFVVKRIDDPGDSIRLEILGLPMAEYPYQPGEIAIFHASMDDMKWAPPDYATPLVGKAATWNGDLFEIESAYLKEHVGSVVVLKPTADQGE